MAAREEFEVYKNSEAERQEAFLKSREFKAILGLKAFKLLKVGFQSCRKQFVEADLLPPDPTPDFPSMEKAISSVPDYIMENTTEEVAEGDQEVGTEDLKAG